MLSLKNEDLLRRNILSWSEADVSNWLCELNYPQHLHMFKENGINGEILVHLDHEALKDLGIHSVGNRLNILREIYHLKVHFEISVEPEHYVPPSEIINETKAKVNEYTSLISKFMIQEDRLNALENDYRKLSKTLEQTFEELHSVKHTSLSSMASSNTSNVYPQFKWTKSSEEGVKSPGSDNGFSTNNVAVSPTPKSAPASQYSRNNEQHHSKDDDYQSNDKSQLKPQSATTLSRQASLGGLSRTKTINDPNNHTKSKSNVKVKLDDSCWKVLPAALKKYKIDDDWTNYALFICYGKTERCLSYDERPLQLFQKLKEQGQQPVFMLRHVKELRSPIAIALQKQQARREAKSNLSPNASSSQQVASSPNNNVTSFRNGKALKEVCESDDIEGYAIAIYPYNADREDEFDVNVNDQFQIVQRAKGWWVVRKESKNEVGWVPTGCLLEVTEPLNDEDAHPKILSNSFSAVALMDYTPGGYDEAGLSKDDKLRVYKKHNHWCYVVKEGSGIRGWAPSWYIGSNKSRDTLSSSASTNPPGSSVGAMPVSAAPLSSNQDDKEEFSPTTPNETNI